MAVSLSIQQSRIEKAEKIEVGVVLQKDRLFDLSTLANKAMLLT
jgi:hypothetical protein